MPLPRSCSPQPRNKGPRPENMTACECWPGHASTLEGMMTAFKSMRAEALQG